MKIQLHKSENIKTLKLQIRFSALSRVVPHHRTFLKLDRNARDVVLFL